MLAFSARSVAAAMKDDFPEPVGPRIRKQTCGFSFMGTLLIAELPEVVAGPVIAISRQPGSAGFEGSLE